MASVTTAVRIRANGIEITGSRSPQRAEKDAREKEGFPLA
jgi:hypothetical protein